MLGGGICATPRRAAALPSRRRGTSSLAPRPRWCSHRGASSQRRAPRRTRSRAPLVRAHLPPLQLLKRRQLWTSRASSCTGGGSSSWAMPLPSSQTASFRKPPSRSDSSTFEGRARVQGVPPGAPSQRRAGRLPEPPRHVGGARWVRGVAGGAPLLPPVRLRGLRVCGV